MTTIADIEALGIELPKTKRLRNGSTYSFMNMGQDAAEGTQAEIREATDELLAVIERLAGFGGASFEAGFQERQRAEQAEADLAALENAKMTLYEKQQADLAAARETLSKIAENPNALDHASFSIWAQKLAMRLLARYQPGGES